MPFIQCKEDLSKSLAFDPYSRELPLPEPQACSDESSKPTPFQKPQNFNDTAKKLKIIIEYKKNWAKNKRKEKDRVILQ